MDLYIKKMENLTRSAAQFICVSVELIWMAVEKKILSKTKGDTYTKEILHTIFFLSYINQPSIKPEEILTGKRLTYLFSLYPDAFDRYKTYLPTRPPYSILLEIVVKCQGSGDANKILNFLWMLNEKMLAPRTHWESRMSEDDFSFISHVISCCYFHDTITDNKTGYFWGGSISCKGKLQKDIMIDILCCQRWNKAVTLAVYTASTCERQAIMLPPNLHTTVYEKVHNRDHVKDATRNDILSHFRWEAVNCHSHTSVNSKKSFWKYYFTKKAPCQKCLFMFPDMNYEQRRQTYNIIWNYGNCAECDSLSSLLNAHSDILNGITIHPQSGLTSNSQKGIQIPEISLFINVIKQRLKFNLKSFHINLDRELLFYDPTEFQASREKSNALSLVDLFSSTVAKARQLSQIVNPFWQPLLSNPLPILVPDSRLYSPSAPNVKPLPVPIGNFNSCISLSPQPNSNLLKPSSTIPGTLHLHPSVPFLLPTPVLTQHNPSFNYYRLQTSPLSWHQSPLKACSSHMFSCPTKSPYIHDRSQSLNHINGQPQTQIGFYGLLQSPIRICHQSQSPIHKKQKSQSVKCSPSIKGAGSKIKK
ncbi:uncharacterized protein LOC103175532 [Callorhinchus milii]|uniref:uncharacterized protein LOC103175532 n=1 Tax=Callorhinchus milii TaxID=7868 RepID=UPI00045742F5|nr:uncharacterized protein LOC103175532 [Callorhinchus milii]XP_007886813.1 uncharacterized protein LOC103175532 [Callorhinchus milii]XP_042198280.1 uncharacterized protein LOC103175532 [Callorhinchus milii]|eukprot:gi/632943176/ref/XP_007886812.1/ PREDICTED: uncharacterized protein LOC103175532 [Callorhinchus milii]